MFSLPRFSSEVGVLPEPLPLPDYVPRPPGTPAPQQSSQERSGLASDFLPRKRRKQRRGQRDKRQPQGGYTINVFGRSSANRGLPSTSYSISDGFFNSAERKLRRDQASSLAQPWPNDKHWNSQHYESRELGEDLPYLF